MSFPRKSVECVFRERIPVLSTSYSFPFKKIDDSNIHPEKWIPGPTSNIDLLSMLFNGPVGLSFVLCTTMLIGLITFKRLLLVKCKQFFLKEKLPVSSNSEFVSSKRKKTRKSRRSTGNSVKKDVPISPENENMRMQTNIGSLLVSNTKIGMGSSGTIIFEGIYEGREVAVKRLLKSHYDVASEKFQILMASNSHPNIVRMDGVEFDQNFVYLVSERCICSVFDLILIYSNPSMNSIFSLYQDSEPWMKDKLRLESVKNVMPKLELWEENNRPSRMLLKLMRDIVVGLGHLHDLGIIHGNLKPKNVLISKQRYVRAKLSNMGISKWLLAYKASLGSHVIGRATFGWQAPELLLHGRQTFAVDLFNLGCVLFFCMTGGKHPFGDRFERDVNILKNQMDLCLVDDIPEAVDLISRLLNPDPDSRSS